MGGGAREGVKMNAVEEIVALYQGRGLYSREELDGCLRERFRVERERRVGTDTKCYQYCGLLEEGSAESPLTQVQ